MLLSNVVNLNSRIESNYNWCRPLSHHFHSTDFSLSLRWRKIIIIAMSGITTDKMKNHKHLFRQTKLNKFHVINKLMISIFIIVANDCLVPMTTTHTGAAIIITEKWSFIEHILWSQDEDDSNENEPKYNAKESIVNRRTSSNGCGARDLNSNNILKQMRELTKC